MDKRNSSVGWGVFYVRVSIGGFLGPPLAHLLHGFSWPTVFYGCAVIVSLDVPMSLTCPHIDRAGLGSARSVRARPVFEHDHAHSQGYHHNGYLRPIIPKPL